MKKLLGMDELYEQLKQMNLISSVFEDMPFCLIRKYAKTLSLVSNINQVSNVMMKLREENKNSLQSLKTLILLNFLLNQYTITSKLKIDEIVTEEVNKIISIERKRYQLIQKDRANPRGLSVQKTVNWLKKTFSKSKQKIDVRMTRTMSHNTKITSINKNVSQLTQVSQTPRQGELPVQGKQQLLISKIIIPYASYLLKMASSQIDFARNSGRLNLKSQEIWKLINSLKCLLKISEVFPTILRYYEKQYNHVIFAVLRIIDYQVKVLYPILQKSVTAKTTLIEKQTMEVYSKSQNQYKKIELLQGIIFKFQLNQFKQILQEVAAVNQLIINVYLGKYTYASISSAGIRQPTLFDDQTKSQLIYDILKQVQKSKSLSKRLSDSKQKNKYINSPTNLSKLRSKTQTSQQGLFTQKKLLIMQAEKKKNLELERQRITQKIEKGEQLKEKIMDKQQLSGSTFRKMRLNTTHNFHLQDSNTRRLRL